MLGSRFRVRTVSGVGSAATDHTNAATTAHSFPNSVAVDFSPLRLSALRSRRRRSILISCNSSPRRSNSDDSHGNDYLEASLLPSGQIAIEKLMDAEFEQESEDCPDQFQFVKKLVGRLDHEVIMVRITERVISTYFARLYLRKPRKSDLISVDAHTSNAITVVNRCKDLVGFHVTPSFCSRNLRMEGTMFFFCNVMVNPQPLKPFSTFPFVTTCSKLLSLQSLKFLTKCNAHSENCNMGDNVFFEDDIFEDDTIFQNDTNHNNTPKPRSRRDNLVPNKWREAQAETKITVYERPKKKKKNTRELVPLRELKSTAQKKGKEKGPFRNVNWDEYKASKKAKLKELNPLVLKNPSRFPVKEKLPEPDFNGERVEPKNPRGILNGKGLEDVVQFLNSRSYNPNVKTTQEGRQKMFTITKEEVLLLNKRMPDLAAATSGKWLPLHTLAACGGFYLLDSLLKHNVDINAVDKDGLTALHKAIDKKLTITKYLLKNSANPFVQDQEGATLMHYAVRIASTETIELLLLYNLDINLQDNDGWTPLHLAVQTRRPNLVRLMLIKGADKTLRNKDGLTPLDLCLYSGQSFETYALIKLLKQSRECL